MYWMFNFVLFIYFWISPAVYHAKVASGEPCWTATTTRIGEEKISYYQPACWYDLTNANSGYLPGSPEIPFLSH